MSFNQNASIKILLNQTNNSRFGRLTTQREEKNKIIIIIIPIQLDGIVSEKSNQEKNTKAKESSARNTKKRKNEGRVAENAGEMLIGGRPREIEREGGKPATTKKINPSRINS